MRKLKLDSKQIKISFFDTFKKIEYNKKTKCTKVTLCGLVQFPTYGYREPLLMRPLPIEATGYAAPSPDDKFDKTIGIKVATAKAESNAYVKAMKLVQNKLVEIQAFTKVAMEFNDKVHSVVAHNDDYIDRITC